ncbi:MAG: hypothetical protein WAK90_03980 [Pseudolabrys sp.]
MMRRRLASRALKIGLGLNLAANVLLLACAAPMLLYLANGGKEHDQIERALALCNELDLQATRMSRHYDFNQIMTECRQMSERFGR